MPTIATAKEIRERHAGRAVVTLPNTDHTVEVKRVDALGLTMAGKLRIDDVEQALARLAGWQRMTPEQIGAEVLKDPAAAARLIDAGVAAACVRPAVTLERTEQSDDVLWIEDLDLEDKLAILQASNRLTRARPSSLERAAGQTPAQPSHPTADTVADLTTH